VFIDKPTVPTQLEVVLDLLHTIRHKNATTETLKKLLQPKGLPDLTASSNQASLQLNAARDLQLITQDEDGNLRLAYTIRDASPSAKESIVRAADQIVLASAEVEPWFGRLYGYVISRPNDEIPADGVARQDLCTQFNSALRPHIERANPLNDTKLPHYVRWYTYLGMGWRDPSKGFIPDPTERLRRTLCLIFGTARQLDSQDFMASLARACPELDGGSLFMDVASTQYNPSDRVCTKALAVALRNLHDDGTIQLDCPKDSVGWSLERGGTVLDQKTLKSDRFDRISIRLSC